MPHQPRPLRAPQLTSPLAAGGASQHEGKLHQEFWIVQQYCNHGTLADAIERGWLWLRSSGDHGPGAPNMLHILHTARVGGSRIERSRADATRCCVHSAA